MIRRGVRTATVAALGCLAVGLAIMLDGAVAFGDWSLREPPRQDLETALYSAPGTIVVVLALLAVAAAPLLVAWRNGGSQR